LEKWRSQIKEGGDFMNNNRARNAVFVTGAGSGIGRVSAIALRKLGFTVFAGVLNETEKESLHDLMDASFIPLVVDITNPDSIRRAVEWMEQTINQNQLSFTGVANIAGIALGGPLEFLPPDLLRKAFEVNVIGQIAVIQSLLPLLRKSKGRIVNMGSIASLVSSDVFLGPYSMSKHALKAMNDCLLAELKPYGIQVSLIAPGAVATPIWERSIHQGRETFSKMPSQADQFYGESFNSFLGVLDGLGVKGIAPAKVAKAVVHAFTAKHPRRRYLIGPDAFIKVILSHIMPLDWYQWVIYQITCLMGAQNEKDRQRAVETHPAPNPGDTSGMVTGF
jgi:NAD(P)-dependent dehydrogenase (short-subunit alcohol dehydrogenase family)